MRMLFTSCLLAAVVLGSCARSGDDSPTAPGPVSSGLPIATLVDVVPDVEVTAGGTGTWNWAGQAVTLPAAGRYGAIRFNWYTFKREPTAFGTLYVLDREYLGLPRDVGPSMPGFIAASERRENGQYVFPASVTLEGSRTYWFYTDTQGAFAGSFDTDIYPGGDLYVSGYPTAPFRKTQASGRMVNGEYVPPPPNVSLDANFRLQGAGR